MTSRNSDPTRKSDQQEQTKVISDWAPVQLWSRSKSVQKAAMIWTSAKAPVISNEKLPARKTSNSAVVYSNFYLFFVNIYLRSSSYPNKCRQERSATVHSITHCGITTQHWLPMVVLPLSADQTWSLKQQYPVRLDSAIVIDVCNQRLKILGFARIFIWLYHSLLIGLV